jgi:MFS transporter, DHA2 family, methylenomycin A resistance protein
MKGQKLSRTGRLWFSLGFAAGPFLGGVLTNYIGWRSIFWINVPIGVVALLMVRAYVNEASARNSRRIDWVGQVLASSALFCLTYSLVEAGSAGWTAPRILIAFGASILLTGTFILVEKSSSSPVLPASLFANSTFSVCVATGLILNFGAYGTLFIESIYLQNIRHLNSFVTGLVILPLTVLPTVTTRLIVNYSSRRHIKGRLVIGQLIAASGAVMLALAFWDSGYWAILIGLALVGVSMGCVMPAITAGVLASSPANTSGVAAGILNSARQVGGTLGVALMGSLFQGLHMVGLLSCFALVLLCFLVMAGVTLRTMQEC